MSSSTSQEPLAAASSSADDDDSLASLPADAQQPNNTAANANATSVNHSVATNNSQNQLHPQQLEQRPHSVVAATASNASTATQASSRSTTAALASDYSAPPPYDERDYKLPMAASAGKLPTYEEVEHEKELAATTAGHRQRGPNDDGGTDTDDAAVADVLRTHQQQLMRNNGATPAALMLHSSIGGFRVITMPPADGCPSANYYRHLHHPSTAAAAAAAASSGDSSSENPRGVGDPESLIVTDDSLLGTDSMFLAAFLLTFIFNWMGFLLITCACHNIACRYGALSGFGLSLAKWTIIVKNSTALLGSDENSWLWWLIMAFGFLICIRAAVQYVSIKRSWRRLTVATAERALVYDH